MRPPDPIITKHNSRNARQIVHEIMIEKGKSRYIPLECGHYSTWDEDELLRAFRPKKGVCWCSNCGKWIPPYIAPKKESDNSEEPLF